MITCVASPINISVWGYQRFRPWGKGHQNWWADHWQQCKCWWLWRRWPEFQHSGAAGLLYSLSGPGDPQARCAAPCWCGWSLNLSSPQGWALDWREFAHWGAIWRVSGVPLSQGLNGYASHLDALWKYPNMLYLCRRGSLNAGSASDAYFSWDLRYCRVW